MKKKCDAFLEYLLDGRYGKMSVSDKEKFKDELRKEPQCLKEFEALEKTMSIVKEVPVPDPGKDYWDNFYFRLQNRLEQEKVQPKIYTLISKPLLRYAAILLAGIFIGYLIFRPGSEIKQMANNPAAIAKQVALNKKTADLLDESQVLLLGIANMDPKDAKDIDLDLSTEKAISGKLLRKTADLKDALKYSSNRRVLDLINDLEIILMQLANIEENNDVPAMELIQSSVNSQAILFKINMEKLLLDAKKEKLENQQLNEKSKIKS